MLAVLCGVELKSGRWCLVAQDESCKDCMDKNLKSAWQASTMWRGFVTTKGTATRRRRKNSTTVLEMTARDYGV